MFDDVEFYLQDLKSKFTKINFEEYFLAYSGGRDSHFLYWFIKEYLKDDKIEIISFNTYMEHKEINKRMIKNADKVIYPKLKPMDIKKMYGSPCFSKIQDEFISRYQKGNRSENTMNFIMGSKVSMFKLNKKARELLLKDNLHKISNKCCNFLKKKPSELYQKQSGKKPILGVRGSEGIIRKSRYNSCFNKNGTFTPIHDLTDELLNKIEIKYSIEVPNIYKYVSRTGCVGCPYGRNIKKELELITPQQRKFVCELFKESYEVLGILEKEE